MGVWLYHTYTDGSKVMMSSVQVDSGEPAGQRSNSGRRKMRGGGNGLIIEVRTPVN